MVKVQLHHGHYMITIPRAIALRLKLKNGEEMAVGFNERGNIEIAQVKK